MLTLDETLSAQNDLGKLCADRPLITKEIFSPNAFYGNDLILKNYLDLPAEYQLKIVIPHGNDLNDYWVWEAERKALLPAIFCYTDLMENKYYKNTSKIIIRSAVPYLYLLNKLKNKPTNERNGTIFFPSHSTHHVMAQLDFDTIATILSDLTAEYHPVTVCIYWKDYLLGNHIPFIKKGLRVVSAGHMFDPNFLFRLHHLCSVHHYSASNNIGTHLFFSIKSGCSFFFLDYINPILMTDYSAILHRDVSYPLPHIKKKLVNLFSKPHPYTTVEQLNFIDYCLGTTYLHLPENLMEYFRLAEKLDNFFFIYRDLTKKLRFNIPTKYFRILKSIFNINL